MSSRRKKHELINLLSDCDAPIPLEGEGGGVGGTPLHEANRDVPLYGVAFSRLE